MERVGKLELLALLDERQKRLSKRNQDSPPHLVICNSSRNQPFENFVVKLGWGELAVFAHILKLFDMRMKLRLVGLKLRNLFKKLLLRHD